jgi:hypothetical protein
MYVEKNLHALAEHSRTTDVSCQGDDALNQNVDPQIKFVRSYQ